MAAHDRCTTGVLAVAYELGRCAVARTTIMRDRARCAAGRARRYWALPVERRMHLPLGAGCGDWRRLIAMALLYRGSLRLFRLIWKRNWLKMSISGD